MTNQHTPLANCPDINNSLTKEGLPNANVNGLFQEKVTGFRLPHCLLDTWSVEQCGRLSKMQKRKLSTLLTLITRKNG